MSSNQAAAGEIRAAAELPPVLMLADHLGYSAGVVHGVTMYFLSVLPALKETGLRFSVCFLRDWHPAAAQLEQRGIGAIFLAAGRMNPLVAFRVARLVREQGIGIIHSSGIKGTLIARIVGRMTGARVIVHLHDLFRPRGLVRQLHRLFARRGDIGLCLSGAAREVAVRGYGVDPGRIRIAHNGIDLARFRNVGSDARARVRRELSVPDQAPVIGMVGRFFPVKGHRSLIEAIAIVARARPDALLVLVGDGPLRKECEEQAAHLGLESNVRFVGQRSDVPDLLAAFDIVAVPSVLEGLGLAGIEALAAGRPVVTYDVGGMREVVTDGVDGRIVAPGDAMALAAALLDLLSDPQKLRRFGANALRSSERFGLDVHIRLLLDCYRAAAA